MWEEDETYPDRRRPLFFIMLTSRILLSYLAIALTCLLPLSAFAHEDTELDKVMEKLNGAMRRLGRQVNDPAKNADSLKDVTVALEQAELAKKHKPALTAEKADKDKFVAEYVKQMDVLIADLGKLEAAFKANDNAAAKDLLKKINDHKKASHKEFQKPHKD